MGSALDRFGPPSIDAMAADAIAFIEALEELDKVDLFGFSIGGMVAQTVAVQRGELVRRMILAGTAPAAANRGSLRLARAALGAFARSSVTRRHPKHYLFFPHTPDGHRAATDYLNRLKERTEDRDRPVSPMTAIAQIRAGYRYLTGPPHDLTALTHPTLVANGDDDVMVPSRYSHELAARLPNATLRIYPDPGHGGVFQHHQQFVADVLTLLEDGEPDA